MQRSKVKDIPFHLTKMYEEFKSILFNQSEEEILAYWHAHADLRAAYANSKYRKNPSPTTLSFAEMAEQFKFAVEKGYKDLIILFWNANDTLWKIYTNYSNTKIRVAFKDAIADFSRFSEMQLTPITTEIWLNNFKVRQWFAGGRSNLGYIHWLDLVKQFEQAVLNADDLIAGAIWSYHKFELKLWYACHGRRIEVDGKPFIATASPERVATVFKASFALKSDVIRTGIWGAAQTVLLSYYRYVDYPASEVATQLSILLQGDALRKEKRKAESDAEGEPERKSRREDKEAETVSASATPTSDRATLLPPLSSQVGLFSERSEAPQIPELFVEDPGAFPLPPLPEDEFERLTESYRFDWY
jgi:hypothetical protein